MQKKPLIFLICIAAALVAGCISSTATGTASPSITNHSPVVTAQAVTQMPTQTPTLSTGCTVLSASISDDTAFLNFVNDYEIIERLGNLVLNGCDKTQAAQINQLIVTHAKPKSEVLISARNHLILASTFCQDPNTAATGRTYEEIKTYSNKLTEYGDLLKTCSDEIKAQSPQSSDQAQSSGTSFSGNGDDVLSFTATGDGLRIFTMSYKGSGNFAIWLKDSRGESVDLLANEIGSYSGRKSERIETGKYYLDVSASGPWSITITSP